MNFLRIHAVALPLFCAITAGIALADSGSFASIRIDVGSQAAAILGPGSTAKVQPFVDDATARIEAAVRSVASTDRTPRAILTMAQKIALLRSRASGTEPDITLSTGQRDELQTYARDVARSILPIVRENGEKIQTTLLPEQIAALGDLRTKTLERIRANAPAAPILPDAMALLTHDGETLSPGAFLLIVDLDPQRIMQSAR